VPNFKPYNHLDKLLIADIIVAIHSSKHNITIQKVKAHTNMACDNEAYKLAKKGPKTKNTCHT
jgi:hypothetical protein